MKVTSVIHTIVRRECISGWLMRGCLAVLFWRMALAAAWVAGCSSERGAVLTALTAAVASAVIACLCIRPPRKCPAIIADFGKENPGDRQQLDAVLFLEEEPAGALRPLGTELKASLQKKYLADNGRALSKALSWRCHLIRNAAALLLLCLSCFFFPGEILRRAWNYCAAGDGIVFTPALPEELCKGEDLPICVKIRRKYGVECPVCVLQVIRGSDEELIEMHPGQVASEADAHLTLYGCNEPCRIRVKTAAVCSAWHSVGIYQRPAPIEYKSAIRPPAYTRLPVVESGDIAPMECVSGSRVEFTCVMPTGQSAVLEKRHGESTDAPWIAVDMAFEARESGEYRLRYRDSAGHDAFSMPWLLQVQPDMPPVIEVTAPGADSDLQPSGDLALDYAVADDFGVVSLEAAVMIDDAPAQMISLPLPGDLQARRAFSDESCIELEKWHLKPGQIISGYLRATDNREPKGNSSESEWFFVTVVAEKSEDRGGDNPGGEGSGRRQTVDIDDLISENKRLIRDSAHLEDGPDRSSEISMELRALELAVRQRAIAIANHAGVEALPGDMQAFFTQSQEALTHAAFLIEHHEFKAAVADERHSLMQLVRLNHILMENTLKMQGQGGGQDSSSQSGQGGDGEKQSAQKEPSRDGNRQEDIRILRAVAEEIRDILNEQRRATGECRMDPSAGNLRNHAPLERHLASRVMAQVSQLSGIAESATVREVLRQAKRELTDSATAFENGRPAGIQSATRGQLRLQQALQELLDQLAQQGAAQMRYISENAERLAGQQRAEARKAADAEWQRKNKALEQNQKALNDDVKALLSQIGELTAALSQAEAPDGEKRLSALRALVHSEKSSKTQRDGQRAVNALRYRRFETAQRSQSAIAGDLEAIAAGLSQIASMPGGMSAEELSSAIEDLQMLSENPNAEEASGYMNGLARRSGKTELQPLAERLSSMTDGAENTQVQSVLNQAIGILRKELQHRLDSEINRQQWLRPSAPPPGKYRREIKNYFQNLRLPKN